MGRRGEQVAALLKQAVHRIVRRGGPSCRKLDTGDTGPERRLALTSMSTATPPTRDLYLVVGYDGSPPASRALDAAVSLLEGRTGRIEVVYVAHLPSIDMLSPGAVVAAAASIRDAHPGDSVAIVAGSSSHAMHRVVGSAAVSLARRSPVPVVVVP